MWTRRSRDWGNCRRESSTVPALRAATSSSLVDARVNFDVETLFCAGIATQPSNGHRPVTDRPTWRDRDTPLAFGACHFCAVEEGVGTPSDLVVLDAPLRNLLIYRMEDFGLCPSDLFSDLLHPLPRFQGLPMSIALRPG